MQSDTPSTIIAERLREAGYKLTQPRLTVVKVLLENEVGLNPKEIHRLCKKIYPSIGLVSVYRSLDLLTDLGLARRVHSEHHCHSYSSAVANQHYMICKDCHRVVEFPCHGLDNLIKQVQQETGFTITGHLLELNGLCPECWKKQTAK